MAYHAPTYPEIYDVIRDFFVSLPPHLIVENPTEKTAGKGQIAEDIGEYVPVIMESDLSPLAKRLHELSISRENGNLFFLDPNLDKEFSSIKDLILTLNRDKAITFLKTCKVLLAMMQKA